MSPSPGCERLGLESGIAEDEAVLGGAMQTAVHRSADRGAKRRRATIKVFA
ncbi:MAG TPA: hypothetical protein VJL29_12915 [Thermoguttaceae bacterium]|nr:hypothetical protein [Thermoguttaceae bacterium]